MFHEPSFGTASRVLPRFHPGFNPLKASAAVTAVHAGQAPETVAEAAAEVVVETRVVVATVATVVVLDVVTTAVVVLAGRVVVEIVLDRTVVVVGAAELLAGGLPGKH